MKRKALPSKIKADPKAELIEIAESVERARNLANAKLLPELFKARHSTDKDYAIFALRNHGSPGWIDCARSRIDEALQNDDGNFFIRFGRELLKKPSGPVYGTPDRRISWLLGLWLPGQVKHFRNHNGVLNEFGLCDFTADAVAYFLTPLVSNITVDWVRKTCERLGLKKARKASVICRWENRKAVFQVDTATH